MSQAAYEFQSEEESSTTEQVKEKAQQVVGQVQETASSAKEQVGDRFTRMVQERSNQTGEQAVQMAETIRQNATSMREQGQDGPARFAEQAADRVQAVGMYLRDNDGDRILSDVEDFARRQPVVVAAGAFALGFLGARFLKASSAKRQASRQTTGPTFEERFEPATPIGGATLGGSTDLGLAGPSGIGTAGAIDTEPPPPIDPALDQPTDFGAPTTSGPGRHEAPPTTSTP
jgi:hypothetical protein